MGHAAGFLGQVRRELEEFAFRERLARDNPALEAPAPPRIAKVYRIWKRLGTPPYEGGFLRWPAEDVHALLLADSFLGQG